MKKLLQFKRILSIILITITAFSLFSCAYATPKDAITDYFDALNRFDFETAGNLLNDAEYYNKLINIIEADDDAYNYDTLQSLYFIDFIYSNISCEILSSVHSDKFSLYNCKISAYNANEVLDKVKKASADLMATDEYLNATDEEKYIMLIDTLALSYKEMETALSKRETEIDIKVITKDEKYYIVPNETFFNALGGN